MYLLDWLPKKIYDTAQGRWRDVDSAQPYSTPAKLDVSRTAGSTEFSGDVFTNTTDRYIIYRRFNFLAKGLDGSSVEVNTASSLELLEFMLVEFKLGTTEQILQKTPVRISTLLESREKHYYDVGATPVVLAPNGNFRIAVSGEVPSALFGGVTNVRMFLTATGAIARLA